MTTKVETNIFRFHICEKSSRIIFLAFSLRLFAKIYENDAIVKLKYLDNIRKKFRENESSSNNAKFRIFRENKNKKFFVSTLSKTNQNKSEVRV